MITTTNYEKVAIAKHVQDIGALRILEIGAFKGETTRVMLDAAGEGARVVVIDPMNWASEVLRNGISRHLSVSFPRLLAALEGALGWASYEGSFWHNVGRAGRSRVVLHRALSTDAELLESLDEELASFDLVFIDGDHSYEGAKHDIERWGSRVRPGGLVLVHDATARFPGVSRALEEWAAESNVEITWPVRDSLCVVRVCEALGRPAPDSSRVVSHKGPGVSGTFVTPTSSSIKMSSEAHHNDAVPEAVPHPMDRSAKTGVAAPELETTVSVGNREQR